MNKRIYTVAILGVGSRGGNVYGTEMQRMPDKFKIVAICDTNKTKLTHYGDLFSVSEEMRFDGEEEFMREKRADILLICTFDNCHARQCIRAFELGYDVLLEKPVTARRDECEAIAAAQIKYSRRALVCHVLRYSPIFLKAAELIDSGRIGKLIYIDAAEPVNYWHHAHSFVRGNSSNTGRAAPMIISKCCHDLDLIQFYAKSRCETVSSIGGLTFFRSDNAPEGAAKRCTECTLINECPYSAKRLYIDRWHETGEPENGWPTSMLAVAPLTEEKLWTAIKEGPYGRCVFHCDNDAADNQTVQMQFENGVKATFSATAFNTNASRRYVFHGTYGMVELTADAVTLRIYGGECETYPVEQMVRAGEAHGGGDLRLIESLYDEVSGSGHGATSLENAIEGYFIGIAAEESRLNGGACVRVHG